MVGVQGGGAVADTHVCMGYHIYVWTGINFGYFSPKLFTVLRQGLLLDLELTDLGELAGHCASGIHPFLPSQSGMTGAHCCPWLLTRVLGM